MKYYLIVGEASGDLHASHLISSLIAEDKGAEFRFFGGDMMLAAAGERGTRVKHYRELAYMGFIPVLLHLRTILSNMRKCKEDICEWNPDVVILVDYPGFNLSIAEYVRAKTKIPVYYYISPKIWAWKEYRIKNIKRDVDGLFSILPFEVPFFEKKHRYPIHYVGNPTADEVAEFKLRYSRVVGCDLEDGGNCAGMLKGELLDIDGNPLGISLQKPVIALLAGSRLQEIKDNLPAMIEAASVFTDKYQLVLAGAPSIPAEYYEKFIAGKNVSIVYNQTYPLLCNSTAALVTSGTATLETALFGVPQVVCYRTAFAKLVGVLRKLFLKVKYVSLVNLISDEYTVPELVADTFSMVNIRSNLEKLLPGGSERSKMLEGYEKMRKQLGDMHAPDNAAKLMVKMLRNCK